MEPGCILQSGNFRIRYFFLQKITAIRKCVFQFVPVSGCSDGTQDGPYFRKFELPNAFQTLQNLVLFVFQLFFIWKHLPLASSANAKMFAEWHNPFLRKTCNLHYMALGPVFFIFY